MGQNPPVQVPPGQPGQPPVPIASPTGIANPAGTPAQPPTPPTMHDPGPTNPMASMAGPQQGNPVADALAPGPLAPATGLTSEFSKMAR